MDSCKYYIDSAECYIDTTSDLEKTLLYLSKGIYGFYASGDKEKVIKIAIRGLELSQKNDFSYYEYKFHTLLAFLYQKNSPQALHHNLKSLEVSKKINNTGQTISTLINLTFSAYSSNNKQLARKYLQELTPLIKNNEVGPVIKVRYLMHSSQITSDLDSAQNYLDSALIISDLNKLDHLKIITYGMKAKLYNAKKPQLALLYFNKLDSLIDAFGQEDIKDEFHLSKAKLYFNLKDYDNAEVFFTKYSKSKYSKTEFNDHNVLHLGYEIYKHANKDQISLKYLEEYVDKYIKNQEESRDSLLIEFQNRYDLYNIQMKSKLKDKELKNKKVIILILSITFSTIIVLILLVFSQKMKKNKIKISLTEEILYKERELFKFRQTTIESIIYEIKNPLTVISGMIDFLESQIKDNKYSQVLEFGAKNTKQLQHDIEGIIHIIQMSPNTQIEDDKSVYLLSTFTDLINNLHSIFSDKNIYIKLIHNLNTTSYSYISKTKLEEICNMIIRIFVKFSISDSTIEVGISASNENIILSLKSSDITYMDNNNNSISEYFSNNDILSKHYESPLNTYLKELNANVNIDKKSIILTCNIPHSCYNYVDDLNLFDIPPFSKKNNNLNIESINLSKILIIDDDTLIIQFYTEILKKTFEIDIAYNGKQAIDMIDKTKYECIISDITMPEMTGIELLELINSSPKTKMLPVIFVTANDDKDTRYKAYKSGVQDFITKPFVIKELITRTQNVINRNKVRTDYMFNEIKTSEPINDKGENDIINRIIHFIDKNINNHSYNVEELATSVFYGKRQLTRITTQMIGLPPSKLILERRLVKAYKLLENDKEIRVSEVQAKIGIKSASYFNRAFKKRFGITPSSLKDRS